MPTFDKSSPFGRAKAARYEAAAERARRDKNPLIPGLRVRHDGWTVEKTQRFLDVLAHTGCVRDAARVAGSSNTSAYRLRRIKPEFAVAWDDALLRAGEGLVALAYARAVHGRETVIYRNGEEYERRVQPDSALLALLIKRGDLAGGEGAFMHKDLAEIPREEILTRAEWNQHIGFSPYGGKALGPDPAVEKRKYHEAIGNLRRRLQDMAAKGENCMCCHQTLPPNWPPQSLQELQLLGVVDLNDVQTGGDGLVRGG